MTEINNPIIENRDDIYRMLVDILHEMFELPVEKLKPEASLYTDLDIDSIDAVDLVVKLGELTGKRMQPDTFKSIRTIDDIVNALMPLLLEKQA